MIVSYEKFQGGLMLREVETEEDAFAEMRRYLEVNKIPSTYTEITWQEVDEQHRITARHKRVTMGCDSDESVTFGIYYEGQPGCLELGSEERWGIDRDKLPLNNIHYYYKSSQHKHVCWYDEVVAYFRDLAQREERGE